MLKSQTIGSSTRFEILSCARSQTNMFKPSLRIVALLAVVFGMTGCPKGNQDFKSGKQAEAVEDLDAAVTHYQQALKSDPQNVEYRLKYDRLRFEAGQHHVETGEELRKKGDLQMALVEFQRALTIDPSSAVAEQDNQATLDAIAAKNPAAAKAPEPPAPDGEPRLMSGPPELTGMSRAPININMTEDAKAVFTAAAKLAGLSVIFDPDFTTRRITVSLTDVTIEQALNVTALEAKAFWKPLTSNIIFVASDQAQKRKDYEEEIVKTIYLKNTMLPQDLTEIVTGLRQLLDLRRVQQFNAQNAIIIRDTPDKVMLAEKIIDGIDKPKSEVVIQFAVLETDTSRMQQLGISPSTSVALAYNPPSSTSTTTTTTTTGTTTSTPASLALNQIQHLSSADYSITMPGASATALLTDSQTTVLDDPEIRVVDGQSAKLSIGDRVPVATGSFQAGVGTTGINPLVNTQFQYLDVGVNLTVTPRVHVDEREVSLKLSVEVSEETGTVSIGGINQPVISSRKIEHDVRLEDGEVNILGGLISRTKSYTNSGIPGISNIPFLKYFGSSPTTNNADQEVLIVVIPHIVRTPGIRAEDLRSLATGTETTPEVRLESIVMSPPIPGRPAPGTATPAAATPASAPVSAQVIATPAAANPAPAQATPATPNAVVVPAAVSPATQPSTPAVTPLPAVRANVPKLHLDPATATLKKGGTATLQIMVDGAQDLYSIPMMLQYNPKIISVDDVLQGQFLSSGGTEPVAVVQRVDKDRGQAIISATRMANAPGVSGNGTVFAITVHGVAPGTSNLSIVQVNARDSKQKAVQFITGDSSIKVEP
jgi:general secretion pathway protein D